MRSIDSKAVSRFGSRVRSEEQEGFEEVEILQLLQVFGFAQKPRNVFFRKVFERVKVLFRRGLSFGLVLFVALSTLSILNRGTDSFGEFLGLKKHGVAPADDTPRMLLVPRTSQGYTSAYSYRPPTGSGRGTSSTRDTIRESSYFLNALQDFSNSLGRFEKR